MPPAAAVVDRTVVDEFASAFVIRMASDDSAPLAALARALMAEPGRVWIVTAPAVTVRPDLYQLLASVIEGRLTQSTIGVRLLCLGPVGEPPAVEPVLRRLADLTGRAVVGNLGAATVGSDGTVAVAAHRGARGGWSICAPGVPPVYEGAWFPVPAWAERLPPDTARVREQGASAIHSVPAGFWILPRGLAPGRAGAAVMAPPDRIALTVFLGGHSGPTLSLTDVLTAVSALPFADHVRLALLPNAVAKGVDLARLRASVQSSVLFRAAVPFYHPHTAWGLAPVAATGQLDWRPTNDDIPVHVRQPSARTQGSRHDPDKLTAAGGHRKIRRRPDGVPTGDMARGTPTPAGWSFASAATPIGVVPASAGAVFEVGLGTQGFQVGGRTVKPEHIADMINACGVLRRRDIIIVGHGPKPTGVAAHTLFGALAQALGRDVIAADADISLSFTGRLFTSGEFRRWFPERPAGHGAVSLGDVLPPVTLALSAPDTAILTAPAHDVPDQTERHVEVDHVDRKRPPTNQELGWYPATNRPPITPLWISPAACDESDRLRLREMLDNNYDAHARAVTKALAAETGTADLHSTRNTVTGLVAVRAYCAGERDAINQVLRGATDIPRSAAASFIGRCAAAGLRRLPVVVGPVFAVCGSREPLAAYCVGFDIAEPAFIDASLEAIEHPRGTVEFAIWSVSARRLGRIASSERSVALFPPGSRFRVLDVESSEDRRRVFLLDVSADPEISAIPLDVAEVLRQAISRPGGREPNMVAQRGFPIGLDDDGRPFALPTRW